MPLNSERETVLIALKVFPAQYDAWVGLAEVSGYVPDSVHQPGSANQRRHMLQFAVQKLIDDVVQGDPVANDDGKVM